MSISFVPYVPCTRHKISRNIRSSLKKFEEIVYFQISRRHLLLANSFVLRVSYTKSRQNIIDSIRSSWKKFKEMIHIEISLSRRYRCSFPFRDEDIGNGSERRPAHCKTGRNRTSYFTSLGGPCSSILFISETHLSRRLRLWTVSHPLRHRQSQ